MKKWQKILILTYFLFFSYFKEGSGPPILNNPKMRIEQGKVIIRQREKLRLQKFNENLKKNEPMLFVLAMRESAKTNLGDTIPNYAVWNKYGYVGAWQINIKYLPIYGMGYFTLEEFIEDPDIFPPELQLIVIKKITKKNTDYFSNHMKYVGKKLHGVHITKEGILYGAHIGGRYGMKRFLKYGRNPKDKFGTSIKDYVDYKNTFHYHID